MPAHRAVCQLEGPEQEETPQGDAGLTKGDIANSKNWQNAADTLGLKHDLGAGESGTPRYTPAARFTPVESAQISRKLLHQRAVAATTPGSTSLRLRAVAQWRAPSPTGINDLSQVASPMPPPSPGKLSFCV